jgi:hypothetical protein
MTDRTEQPNSRLSCRRCGGGRRGRRGQDPSGEGGALMGAIKVLSASGRAGVADRGTVSRCGRNLPRCRLYSVPLPTLASRRCDGFERLGQLGTHSHIQRRYYHAVHSWLGTHSDGVQESRPSPPPEVIRHRSSDPVLQVRGERGLWHRQQKPQESPLARQLLVSYPFLVPCISLSQVEQKAN